MPDREKVIKAFKMCDIYTGDLCQKNNCPYFWDGCRDKLKKDIVALLKEQEAVVRCKDCRYGQCCTDGETTYQCFKWNSGEFGMLHEQNWFCADGEKRTDLKGAIKQWIIS